MNDKSSFSFEAMKEWMLGMEDSIDMYQHERYGPAVGRA